MNRSDYVKAIERDLATTRQDGSAASLRRKAELERELARFTDTPDKPTIEKAAR